jgi:hypothetical protein
LKIGKDFKLIIRRAKRLELMIFFITNFSTFGSNMFLTLKNMDFENVTLTKVVHIYVIEGMNALHIYNKITF